MSHAYRAVGWNRQKRVYDLLLVGGVLAYLAVYVLANLTLRPQITAETLLIRAFGTAALVLLHVVLSIGPLCRLDSRFLPLLYNRRHMGVTMFVLALAHGGLSIVQFHTLGELNPLVSVLVSNGRYASLASFPFQPLGLAALVILFLMAATSHDFWLANLTPPVWKALHMGVYVAYALVVLHVALGVLQAETSPILTALLGLGLAWVVGLHLLAARRETALDTPLDGDSSGGRTADDGFVRVCRVDEIPEARARVVTLAGERIAVFRYDGRISALSNVCQHQNGPLGEGFIADGCVTCPWHGFQYAPDTGASPPPFEEKVPTFHARVHRGDVFVHPRPNPPGTPVAPAACEPRTTAAAFRSYVGYVAKAAPWVSAFLRPRLVALVALAAAVGVLVTAQQRPFAAAAFEFQRYTPFVGTIVEEPYPMLLVERPGRIADGVAPVSVFPLTVFGKRSAAGAVTDLDGAGARLEGELIYRGGGTMLQLRDSSVQRLPASGEVERLEYVGEATLEGEIVDAKCYLGVMKPGREKPHRACASLCIRGGVPPLLLVETTDGESRRYLLMGSEGAALGTAVLPFVAERVRVSGQEYRLGDFRILASEPATFERVD